MHTKNDILKEKIIFGAELAGKYEFPCVPCAYGSVKATKAVPFNACRSEKNPKQALAHFFIDDMAFERVWNQPEKYIDILKNFKYVCTPDFSFYSGMPFTLQLYNVYRSRALGYWFWLNGINIIPTVGWSGEESFDYCFDGLPINSILAVSTNGCFSEQGKLHYKQGFSEMCKRLHPSKVVVVGREIPVEEDAEIIYFNSFGQDMSDRLRGDKDNGK